MAVTKKILEFLSRYQDLKDRIVIDHLTPEIWDLLSQEPYMLGMTLQDGKASLGDLMTLLDQQPQLVSRLMLNSDAAVRLSEPYLDLIQGNLELLDQFQEMLLWRNAVSFFEIPL
jgi:predicted metal-dependent TIM-barrel fold hydrolase